MDRNEMIFSALISLLLLAYTLLGVLADSAIGGDCQVSTGLPDGYCPSSCEVEEEMIRFHREMAEYLTQQDVFLQEVKDDIERMNANLDPHEDMILSESQTSIRTAMEKLQKDVSSQQSYSIALRRNITLLKQELADLTLELEDVQEQCEDFCTSDDTLMEREHQREDVTEQRSNGCGDELCFRAAHTGTATVVREMQDGVVCPQYETAPAKNCADLYNLGYRESGIYRVTPSRSVNSFHVFCDMQDAGGGWTVIQRRNDGSVDFNRTWQEYATGFGYISCSKEFWIGNKNLEEIGRTGFQTVRFTMTDWENETRVAQYSYFKVNSVEHLYTLQLSYYQSSESNCSDSMIIPGALDSAKFSTRDRRSFSPPLTCQSCYDGWWLNSCQHANLNGYYYHQATYDSRVQPTGIIWPSWKGTEYSLKATEIKLRPYSFTGSP